MIVRDVVEVLGRETLKRILDEEGVTRPKGRSFQALKSAIEAVPLRRLLPWLSVAELKTACEALELDAKGRSRAKLAARILEAEGPVEGYTRYPLGQLKLDLKNPRLLEYGFPGDASQFDLLKMLWDYMAVNEIASSIAYCGYYNHEPLLLEREGPNSFIVIEGNRRLAAVMLLLDAGLRRRVGAKGVPDIDSIDSTRREELQSLPAVITTRREAWRYLGFKHVNGPATWGAYAKAQYAATVHHEYGVPLEEIAQQIGDYSFLVQRQYRGLMVLEQAEEAKVFSRSNIAKNKFYFNYIYTGLDLPGFQHFLGIPKKKRDQKRPVPASRVKNLGDLLQWLYGNKQRDKPSLIRSQNPDLKTLDATLLDEKGVKALRDGLPLNVAHEISLGDEQIFVTALHEAKQALQRAQGTLTLGFTGKDASLLRTAEEIDQIAAELLEAMQRKSHQRRRPRKSGRSPS